MNVLLQSKQKPNEGICIEEASVLEVECNTFRLEEAERKAKQEAAKKTERERQYKEVQKKEMQRLQTVKQKQREVCSQSWAFRNKIFRNLKNKKRS